MPNYLKMELINSICALHQRGWSKRRIARELKLDRDTVRRYLRAAASSQPTPTLDMAGENHPLSIPGVSNSENQNQPISIAGDLVRSPVYPEVRSSAGGPSKCEGQAESAESIRAKLEQGLSAQRIYQDLVADV